MYSMGLVEKAENQDMYFPSDIQMCLIILFIYDPNTDKRRQLGLVN